MNNQTIQLTTNQQKAVNNIASFAQSNSEIFILTGAAGTGKTTVVKNIIDELTSQKIEVILLAPTNRAAKILSRKTGVPTNTIHSEIYRVKEIKNDDGIVIETRFIPRIGSLFVDEIHKDDLVNKVYIVDESSMISDTANTEGDLTSSNSVLYDLYNHVMFSDGKRQIVFVGDSYQLPPIKHVGIAPALDKRYIQENYTTKVVCFELTDILRQKSDSYILDLAQDIKTGIDNKQETYNIRLSNTFNSNKDFIKSYAKKIDPTNDSKAIALGWTKKSVLAMNLDVRKELFGEHVKEIEVGDIIYLNAKITIGHIEIPRGESGKIIQVINCDGIKGKLLFHTVKVEFVTLNHLPITVTTKIFTDFLYTTEDYFSKELFIKLAIERSKENPVFKKTKKSENDPYMNAMQAKFGYALTVHKAQGGEWENVYLHKLKQWNNLRWNYTAVTRAAKEIYTFF